SGPNPSPLALHNPERYKNCIESAVRNWDSGSNLQAQFAREETPAVYYSLRSNNLFGENTKEDWESRLDAYVGPVRDKQRTALQNAMEAKLASLETTKAARVMDFTEAVLRAYIYLGLPESLESDELLRARLFGEGKKLIGGQEQLAVTHKAYLD